MVGSGGLVVLGRQQWWDQRFSRHLLADGGLLDQTADISREAEAMALGKPVQLLADVGLVPPGSRAGGALRGAV
jgi:hypothetical protein